MKYIILLFFLLLLSGCYSANTPEHYIHFGTRAYGIQYGGEKYFEVEPKNGPTYFFNQILTGKFSKTSTNAQKAYAYMYLARIKLRRNLLRIYFRTRVNCWQATFTKMATLQKANDIMKN